MSGDRDYVLHEHDQLFAWTDDIQSFPSFCLLCDELDFVFCKDLLEMKRKRARDTFCSCLGQKDFFAQKPFSSNAFLSAEMTEICIIFEIISAFRIPSFLSFWYVFLHLETILWRSRVSALGIDELDYSFKLESLNFLLMIKMSTEV